MTEIIREAAPILLANILAILFAWSLIAKHMAERDGWKDAGVKYVANFCFFAPLVMLLGSAWMFIDPA